MVGQAVRYVISVRELEHLEIRRGDIYYADLSPVLGSEQGGVRPVLVLQNDIGNKYSPTIIVSAITSQINRITSYNVCYTKLLRREKLV